MPDRASLLRVLAPPAALLATGCGLFEPDCGALDPSDGEEVAIQLTVLGYGDYEDTGDSYYSDGTKAIHTSEEEWDAQTEAWGTSGGLDPDFATHAVFENRWVFGGCGESYEYTAWRWGERLRVRGEHVTERRTCDAALPQIDLVLVKLGGATDLAWCE